MNNIKLIRDHHRCLLKKDKKSKSIFVLEKIKTYILNL